MNGAAISPVDPKDVRSSHLLPIRETEIRIHGVEEQTNGVPMRADCDRSSTVLSDEIHDASPDALLTISA